MKTTFIYFLRDPANSRKGYLGKSDKPKARLSQHRCESFIKKHPRAVWINSLTLRGLSPLVEIVDEVPRAEWKFWEKEYIRVFLGIGFTLVNGNLGGGGVINHTQETRKKMRLAKLGTKHTAEHNVKIGASRVGKKRTPDILAKSWATRSGIKQRNNTSGFTGVSWEGKRKKWTARHTEKGREINIGRFSSLEDAVFVRALTRENACKI